MNWNTYEHPELTYSDPFLNTFPEVNGSGSGEKGIYPNF